MSVQHNTTFGIIIETSLKMFRIYIISFFLLFPGLLAAQLPDSTKIMAGQAIDGDTLLFQQLPVFEYIYYTPPTFKTHRAERRYTRLVKDIKKVYPYAKEAGKRLQIYAPILDSLKDNRKEQKVYFNIIEDQLFDQYGDDLKKLNTRQGRILIKLVDRECQVSSYQVVRDFRGSVSAFFWQGFARLWGYNLKEKYDPYKKDKKIESIIQAIEYGML